MTKSWDLFHRDTGQYCDTFQDRSLVDAILRDFAIEGDDEYCLIEHEDEDEDPSETQLWPPDD